MSVDRLSNMLSAIKNAFLVGKRFVEIPYTKECEEVAKILKENRFLEEVKAFKDSDKSYKNLRLDIAYDENGVSRISDITRISKPGKRVYRSVKDLRSVAGGFGVLVVSTSRGMLTGKEAKRRKLGGEVLCSVW